MKDKITKASILLFEEKGFSETSIQDIVEALGVTKGTYYYYFTSKEQLLMEIHLDYISDLLKRQQTILESANLSCRKKLEEIIALLIHDIQDKGPSGRVFFREMRHLIEENVKSIEKQRDLFRLNIEQLITDGIDAGEFRKDLRADIAAFGVLGIANYSYNWFNPMGEMSADKLSELFSGMLLEGIVPR
ncbi:MULTISPECIES: TetR/AcrR family transcriptional regulator [unclassified Sporosarcina]|uniref:TetR/AcrR family transcriptional regulator n=1 Tax=unclassified Sporosarcina TaxID=2647733 RepID=UPI0020405141|nr:MULTISPECIES: TetR/AcrR family transcriptional regulator [unclassified Sporosarcina]GKV67385.1 TetR family transcriptional regulator [Sporosarcina sp. NCCP-2331]GLB57741.1 TetR family transcriptional regulator [Sporosarcina sp. NCCP-2378]